MPIKKRQVVPPVLSAAAVAGLLALNTSAADAAPIRKIILPESNVHPVWYYDDQRSCGGWLGKGCGNYGGYYSNGYYSPGYYPGYYGGSYYPYGCYDRHHRYHRYCKIHHHR